MQKKTFDVGQQVVNHIENDAVLLCCEASYPIGGFVAAQFILKDPARKMMEIIMPYWGLPMFAGGKFTLRPYTICPWCKRDLPTIEVVPKRTALS
jgi:hypothetical protein